MEPHSHIRDRSMRRAIVGVWLSCILALALLPGHGHNPGLQGLANDFGIPEHAEGEPDFDCLLCQLAGSASLPTTVQGLEPDPKLSDATGFHYQVSLSTFPSRPSNARAPPAA